MDKTWWALMLVAAVGWWAAREWWGARAAMLASPAPALEPAKGERPAGPEPVLDPGPARDGPANLTIPEVLAPAAGRIEALAEPAVRLIPDSTFTGRTRLGGVPEGPPGATWPRSPKRPLAFLGQLDLAEVAAAQRLPGLPERGLLQLFYDLEEQPWGGGPEDELGYRIVWYPGDATLAPMTPPPGVERVTERRLRPVAWPSLPSSTNAGFPADLRAWLDFADERFDAYDALAMNPARPGRPAPPEEVHQVGGRAGWIQDEGFVDVELAHSGRKGDGAYDEALRAIAASNPWRLVWQLDSDDAAGFMFGDSGRLYLLARAEDLAAGRLDRTRLLLQCY